jgi:DNA-binding NarL/FixJ family response regulator
MLGHLALAQALLGDVAAAAATADRAMLAASDLGEGDAIAAAELALAWVCLENAEYDAAERHAAAATACGSVAPVLAVLHSEVHRRLEASAPVARRADKTLLLVEPLTAREMEVLRHLDHLLPTEEIAAEMYISVNTVKTHVRAILRKLSAERRYDAVRRAREIGLL